MGAGENPVLAEMRGTSSGQGENGGLSVVLVQFVKRSVQPILL